LRAPIWKPSAPRWATCSTLSRTGFSLFSFELGFDFGFSLGFDFGFSFGFDFGFSLCFDSHFQFAYSDLKIQHQTG
jgi:hypothetical protein